MPRRKDPADGVEGGPRRKRVRIRNRNPAPADWDVDGLYQLTCTSRYQPVDASEYVLDLRWEPDTATTAQLYAFFSFQKINLKGVMRLCPTTDERLSLPAFETASNLSQDIRPGRTRMEWLMRWRGEESGGKKVGGETRAQYQWLFNKKDVDGMKITFSIVHDGKHILFEGVRIGRPTTTMSETSDGTVIPAVQMMLREWARLNVESWEEGEEIQPGKYAVDYAVKNLNKWENPPPGGVIVAKNKPGRNPGDFTNGVTPIEELPEWAWDVTGTYILKSPQLAKRLGLNDLNTEMTITVHLENHAQHVRVGRQLWGDLDFHRIQGNFRLCPGSTAAPYYMTDYPAFEHTCPLHLGQWPGPQPQGEPQWGLIWRGYSREIDAFYAPSTMSEIFFSESAGQMLISGIIIIDSTPLVLLGSRFGGPEVRSKNARSVMREWPKFLTRPPEPEAKPQPEAEPEPDPQLDPEAAPAHPPSAHTQVRFSL